MKTPVPSHNLSVPADAWRRLREAQARVAALTKEVDALKGELGIPSAPELARLVGATADDSAAVLVIDGNGQPLGKVSVYWRDSYTVNAGFVARIS